MIELDFADNGIKINGAIKILFNSRVILGRIKIFAVYLHINNKEGLVRAIVNEDFAAFRNGEITIEDEHIARTGISTSPSSR